MSLTEYPQWAIFIDKILEALYKKEQHFRAAQEGLRKDFERTFGVLSKSAKSALKVLSVQCIWMAYSAKFLSVLGHGDSVYHFKTCIIIHNMMVLCRMDGYGSVLFENVRIAVQIESL